MSGFISASGEGKVHEALGVRTTLKATSDGTNGAFDALEADFPAELSFPPHTHRQADEAFYVLEGELIVQVGERAVTATPGTFGFAPRGVVHGFENKTVQPARVLIWQMPAPGNERFLDELAQLPPGPPDLEALLPILEKYDVQLAEPPPNP